MTWSPDPPWGPQDGDLADERLCVRCGFSIPPQHRHFWKPCRPCAIWSFLGTQLLALLGVVGAREFIYWGFRPDCPTCVVVVTAAPLDDAGGPDQHERVGPAGGAGARLAEDAQVLVLAAHVALPLVAGHEVLVGSMPLAPAVKAYLDRNVEPIEQGRA